MTSLNHLVVGVDGSAGSKRAAEWSAAQTSCTRLTLVHGFSPGMELLTSAFQINLDPVRAEHARLLETTWSEPARGSDATVATVLMDANPAEALVHIAERRTADAIVIGHDGHSQWSNRHVGDVATRLLHRCETPLILTSGTTTPQPLTGTIVIGLSRPTAITNPELSWSLDVAEQVNAQVHLVSLVEPLTYVSSATDFDMSRIHAEIRSQMDALVATLRRQHRSMAISSEVRDGPALHELAAVAEEVDAQMVVVGSHHPRSHTGFVAGSISRLLPSLISCPMAAIPCS